jgi:adenosylhomocysteine nucleosidase
VETATPAHRHPQEEFLLAIMSATHEELAAIVRSLADASTQEFGQRHYHRGKLAGTEVVAVFSRWGKVAAAATAAQLISSFAVTRIIFSGVAGAVSPDLAIGDVVVGSALLQHDMDARPLYPRYEVPLLGKARFASDGALRAQLSAAAHAFLDRDLRSALPAAELSHFRIRAPKVIEGLIASGDKFFASAEDLALLRRQLPDAACVEMEGAAVAQVCAEYAIPFGIVRTISDSADENSAHDFPRFSREIAGRYSLGVILRFLTAPAITLPEDHT